METTDAFTQGQSLIRAILQKMDGVHEWKRRFVTQTLMLFLTIRGRINFLQLGRFGQYDESTYRRGFGTDFDFLHFNIQLAKEHCSEERILAFDQTFINKSGKCTPGLGYFHNSTANRQERGLEISCLAVVDMNQHTAYHLEAIQTPSADKDKDSQGSLVDHYAAVVVGRAPKLCEIGQILVVDGYFGKKNFLDPVVAQTDLTIVGKLRKDFNGRYLYYGPRNSKGRPRQYDGKINVRNIDKKRIKLEYEDDQVRIYSGVINLKGMKRNVRLCYIEYLNGIGQVQLVHHYFSTDLEMKGTDIARYYHARFQIEFLFRDSKGHTGLKHCQARNKPKFYYHVNASLTAASLAKYIQRTHVDKTTPLSYSIANIKTEIFNHYLLKKIFSIYRIDQNMQKNDDMFQEILNYGKIAA